MKNLVANPRTKQGRIEAAKMKVELAVLKYGPKSNKTIAMNLAYLNLKLTINN